MPLTGWLASSSARSVPSSPAILAFGVCSLLCGLSSSLGMLLGMRVLLGLFGGPLMPLSQTLLLRIFPKEKATPGDRPLGDDDADRRRSPARSSAASSATISAGTGSSSSTCRSRLPAASALLVAAARPGATEATAHRQGRPGAAGRLGRRAADHARPRPQPRLVQPTMISVCSASSPPSASSPS